jgi:hypothetical protein
MEYGILGPLEVHKADRILPLGVAAWGLASHWPFDEWGHFLPDETTVVSMIDCILLTPSWS